MTLPVAVCGSSSRTTRRSGAFCRATPAPKKCFLTSSRLRVAFGLRLTTAATRSKKTGAGTPTGAARGTKISVRTEGELGGGTVGVAEHEVGPEGKDLSLAAVQLLPVVVDDAHAGPGQELAVGRGTAGVLLWGMAGGGWWGVGGGGGGG